MTASALAPKMPVWRQQSVLPGFGLTLGFTLAYLGLIVLIPLGALFVQTAGVGWQALWTELTSARAGGRSLCGWSCRRCFRHC